MSILTSDEPNKAVSLVKKLIQFNVFLSCLSYLAGLGLFAFLIHEPMKASFHDNSLLPGLANREFVDSPLAERYLEELKNISETLPKNHLPLDYLKAQFESFGLEAYEHRYSFKYPLSYDHNRTYDGANFYAIFRAARSTSTECIVISSPYRSGNNPNESTLPSIALMLSLAKFFRTKNYWAKDIVYLIFGDELLGIQAWLQSYHGMQGHNDYLESEALQERAGVIQAALNLELKSFQPPFLQINLEGLNGQLPNLDLFNVAVELCNRESVPVVFHGDSFYVTESEWDNWLRKATTMFSMMATQATMLPTGGHGVFQKYAISSITLEAPGKKSKFQMVNGLTLGRSIEGIVRSLNNMMEKFNRSFYFYLLASTRRFISISSYMIVFGLLAVPLAFRSLYYYFEAWPVVSQSENATKSSSSSSSEQFNFWASFKPCFLAHLYGILAIGIVTLVLTRLGQSPTRLIGLFQNINLERLAYSVLITLALISALNQLLMVKSLSKSRCEYCLQAMLALLNALLLLTSISLINISLALALTIIYVPLLTIVSIQDHQNLTAKKSSSFWLNRLVKTLKFIALFLIHPIILHLICLSVLSIWMDPQLEAKFSTISQQSLLDWLGIFSKHLRKAFNAQPRTVLNFIEDWYLFDNWAFPIITLFLYPVWLQIWFQATALVE